MVMASMWLEVFGLFSRAVLELKVDLDSEMVTQYDFHVEAGRSWCVLVSYDL